VTARRLATAFVLATGTLLLATKLNCQTTQTHPDSSRRAEPLDVSIIQLVANPAVYDGKVVRLIGFIHFEFEGNAIYLHKEDYDHAITNDGLWVDLAPGFSAKECQGRYVIIEGTFRANDHGHMGMWSGAVRGITRCDPWSAWH
jgi:hypothetical protein